MPTQSEGKIREFIELATMAGEQSNVLTKFIPFVVGDGVQIVSVEHKSGEAADLDRFLIEITSLADQKNISLQLSLLHNDLHMRTEFTRYGFEVVEASHHLQMERSPQSKITQTEYDMEDQLGESAPPGKKAERFIKHQKKDFKKRYGKNWKKVLYATAWKQFGEGMDFKGYLSLIESERTDC